MSVPTPALDGSETSARESILDHACRLFAEHGFSGTSMRALARAAQTSQGLIHHHFGTKSRLYKAVRTQLIERLANSELLRPHVPDPGLDPVEELSEAMQRYADFLEQNPEFLRLATWARLEGDHEPWANHEAMLSPMTDALHALQDAGLLRRDLDVNLHMSMIGGIVEHWVAHRQMYAASFAPGQSLTSLTSRYFAQVARVIAHGASMSPESP